MLLCQVERKQDDIQAELLSGVLEVLILKQILLQSKILIGSIAKRSILLTGIYIINSEKGLSTFSTSSERQDSKMTLKRRR